jgi:glycosyltransferase involved in cell wall biosynthesis
MANAPAMVALYLARRPGLPYSFTGHAAGLFVQRAARSANCRTRRLSPASTRGARSKNNGSCGQTCPKKGINQLLQAFIGAETLSEWTILVLGDGHGRAGSETLANDLYLSDRLEFWAALPHVVCLAAIADVGMAVLPCRTATNGDKEGISVVLIAAIAGARAAIAGNPPTIREFINEGEHEMLSPPDQIAELGASITQGTGNPGLRARLGGAARERVAAEFNNQINWPRLGAALDLVKISSAAQAAEREKVAA